MDCISQIVKTYTGAWLALNKASPVIRAFAAADLVTGDRQLVQPMKTQAARLCRVPSSYVLWAIRNVADRELIEAGAQPLVPTPMLALPKPVEVSDPELIEIVRTVGAERTFRAIEAVI